MDGRKRCCTICAHEEKDDIEEHFLSLAQPDYV